jgi:hypothetical protein
LCDRTGSRCDPDSSIGASNAPADLHAAGTSPVADFKACGEGSTLADGIATKHNCALTAHPAAPAWHRFSANRRQTEQ